MMEFLTDVPPMLLAAWGSWFLAGGVLALWYRRATELEYAPVAAPAPRPAARSKTAVRHADAMTDAAPAADPTLAPVDDAYLYEAPPAVAPAAAREKKPVVVGDPFGELATLLDQAIAPPVPSSRMSGDSPILSSSGAPLHRANDEPKLG